MTYNKMTIALTVAERFNNDGQRWTDDMQIGLRSVCDRSSKSTTQVDLVCPGSGQTIKGTLHVFSDDSALFECAEYWDITDDVGLIGGMTPTPDPRQLNWRRRSRIINGDGLQR